MRRLAVAIATGFGLGYSPFAPGTVGSIWGVLIVLAVNTHVGWIWQTVVAVVLAAAAIWPCDVAEKYFSIKDPGKIVADEYLTFPICMIGLPVVWWMLGIAFVANRFFDIVKLPPAHKLQDLHGGIGIVIDDVFASLYALAFNHAAYWVVMHHVLPRLG